MKHTSSNPAFGDKVWERMRNSSHKPVDGGISLTATIQGTINKTFILILFLLATAAITWTMAPQLGKLMMPIVTVAVIATLIMTIMLVRNPVRAKNFAIAYALIEGVLIGAISYLFDSLYPNIVVHATVGTAGVVC
jgi:uncharacterized YccA/Bax inhibitor family protein